jgi:uncharacterized membrane protein
MMSKIRTYFFTGLLVLVPLAITLWVILSIVNAVDNILPRIWQPKALFGFDIPGFGFVMVILLVFIVGFLSHNFIGKQVVAAWNSLLNRIPVVRGLYNSIKQVSDTLFSENGNAFREAVLVQYPHAGLWTIAFVTGKPNGEVAERLHELGKDDVVSVYVPTTPNPTSGFFLMLPRSDLRPLEMSVDEALKYIISMGVVSPITDPNDALALPAKDKPTNRN